MAAASVNPEDMEHSNFYIRVRSAAPTEYLIQAAPALLAHISILIAIYGGVMLATSARLKWDPTTYILVRELLPKLYRACAAYLPVAGVLLIAQAHLALAALVARSPGTKRVLWLVYIVCTVVMLVVEVPFAVWIAVSVLDLVRCGDKVEQHTETTDYPYIDELFAEIKKHLESMLGALIRLWLPMPAHLQELIQEAKVDAPVNGYVALGAGVVLLVLQLAALLSAGLALLSADLALAAPPAPPPSLANR